MEELDFEDVLSIHPDEDLKRIEPIETDANSNLEQAFDSDSGEIDDDEEANDLEEGEIKDSGTVVKKKSDIACRFFKRGSCAFGSQCQYLHVSDSVYKMFDTNPQRRNDMQPGEHNNFLKPILFHPTMLPPIPYIGPPISVVRKPDFHRQCETLEDTWEKGLETAKILIRKANLKKQNESEPKKFISKNNKCEKLKGQYFTKANLGNDLDLVGKKHCEKALANNNLRREDACGEKKSNYRYQPRSSDRWVDPWRRSKSPLNKKRLRSLSGSPPPRSRKHSYGSSTSSISSSSDSNGICRRPYKRKSPRGRQVSRSRSISQSRQPPKTRRISPKHSFNGRRNSRSSRSFSGSPNRKRTSRTRSRSSSSSSCSDCEISSTFEDKEMKRISTKLSEQFHQKSPNRASSLLDSDCETSEMTVSSASCTSASSYSETESPHHSPSFKRKQSPSEYYASSYSSKTTRQANPKVFSRSQCNLPKSQDLAQHKDVVPTFQKKMHAYNSGKNQNNKNLKPGPTDCRPKNTPSCFNPVKKPASEFSKSMSRDVELLLSYHGLGNGNWNSNNVPKVKPSNPALRPNKTDDAVKVANKANSNSESCDKISKVHNDSNRDVELLFRYQGLTNANNNSNYTQKAKPNNPALKPNKIDAAAKVADKANIYSESHDKISKARNVPKQNIVLNLQPKSKDHVKPEILNKPQSMDEMATVNKKEVSSKREQLLNRLKLVEDAIARKKCK